MNKWIRIKNQKTVHRLFLEIIGLGTKQKGDNTKVGQWASGFKLATPAALRLGIEIAATSTDAIGPFILRFDTQEIEVAHEGRNIIDRLVVYKYSDGRITHAPVALGAFKDWSHAIGDDNNPLYPIIREYIANARDEDRSFTWCAGITCVMQAEPGTSAVYMEETPEALDILYNHSDRYFKFFGALPLFRVMTMGAIYAKSSPDATRRFNDGYLVDCIADDNFNASLFDYDAYGKDIVNEIRTIKSDETFYGRIAKLLVRIKNKDLLRQIIKFACANSAAVEREFFSRAEEKEMSDSFKKMCREIFEEMNGPQALLSCGSESYDSYMQALGYTIISYEYKMRDFFEKIGIVTSRMAYEKRLSNIKYSALSPTEHARLSNIVMKYLVRVKSYRDLVLPCPIGAMHDPLSKNMGLCVNNYSTIYLADNIFSDDDVVFLSTLCHELDHYESKKHDSNYIKLMDHKDNRNARNLIMLAAALDKLEELGVDISTLHPDLVPTKKTKSP